MNRHYATVFRHRPRADDGARLSKDLKYYNPDVHASAFALPNFVKDVLDQARAADSARPR